MISIVKVSQSLKILLFLFRKIIERVDKVIWHPWKNAELVYSLLTDDKCSHIKSTRQLAHFNACSPLISDFSRSLECSMHLKRLLNCTSAVRQTRVYSLCVRVSEHVHSHTQWSFGFSLILFKFISFTDLWDNLVGVEKWIFICSEDACKIHNEKYFTRDLSGLMVIALWH